MSSEGLVLALDHLGDDLDIEGAALEPLGFTVARASEDPEALDRQLSKTDGLLTEYSKIDGSLLERAPRCRAVVTYTVGYDQVDLEAARRRGVVVANIPGYCTEEVADHAMALVLALSRSVLRGDSIVRSDSWGVERLGALHRLRGRTLGLVGFGRIARAVASRGRAFGLRILAFDPGIPADRRPHGEAEFVEDLRDLLGTADVVSLHAPLLPVTEGMIDRAALAAMKPGSFLVNTSRGKLIDMDGLLHALDHGPLAGAALDVFPTEPPDVARLDRPDLILTPHMAYYSIEAIREAKAMAAGAMVEALRSGAPSNRLA
jgi:D-3-phosphoglycerate dehydrogenase